MLVHLIADFGPGDLAFAEVIQRLHVHLGDVSVVPTPVPAFATLAAGFCVAQLALGDAPAGTLVFHNVAPRRDDARPRQDQAGEALACCRTPTGVTVVGVNAGHAFSFLQEAGMDIRAVTAATGGSQFRSRDVFPAALARVVSGETGAVGESLADGTVPAVPEDRLAYIDGFGNLKTTVRADRLEPGTRVRLTIEGAAREAHVAGGGFSVPEGELAFSVGSSGWRTPVGNVRWAEVFLRGGSAWEAFGRPAHGARVHVEGLPVTT